MKHFLTMVALIPLSFSQAQEGVIEFNTIEDPINYAIEHNHDLIVICYTQFMGGETKYATEFKATVDRALID